MHHKLNPDQEKYLSEIWNMVIAHTTKKNPNYEIAEELKKIGFLKLIKTDSPLIGIVLTDIGKEYIKTREELLERKLKGKEDYQMTDGNYPDRYETLLGIRLDDEIRGTYTIYELDKIKLARITTVDKDTGLIIKEAK